MPKIYKFYTNLCETKRQTRITKHSDNYVNVMIMLTLILFENEFWAKFKRSIDFTKKSK